MLYFTVLRYCCLVWLGIDWYCVVLWYCVVVRGIDWLRLVWVCLGWLRVVVFGIWLVLQLGIAWPYVGWLRIVASVVRRRLIGDRLVLIGSAGVQLGHEWYCLALRSVVSGIVGRVCVCGIEGHLSSGFPLKLYSAVTIIAVKEGSVQLSVHPTRMHHTSWRYAPRHDQE